MKSTDLFTRWRLMVRLEMRSMLYQRRPWERHSKAAMAYAFKRCREDAEHNAALALGYTVDDLRAAGGQFEVREVGAAESTAPTDTDGFKEGGEILPVFEGDVGNGECATVPHPAKIDSAALTVC